MTWIQKITNELIETLLTEIYKEHNMTMIQDKILEPMINITFTRLYPYIITTSIIFFLTFILAVAILFVIIRK